MLRESSRTHWPWWMWETQFIEKALKRRRGIGGWFLSVRDSSGEGLAVAVGRVRVIDPGAGVEEPLAQRLAGLVSGAEAAAPLQLRDHQLDEVGERVEAVPLAQVDRVEAVVIEPGLDLVGDFGGGANRPVREAEEAEALLHVTDRAADEIADDAVVLGD